MNSETICQSFTRCSAAICPLCQTGGEIWFADEPVCGKHGMMKLFPWIKTQRKLARKSEQNHEIGYFTVESLTKIHGVGRRTAGMNPDTPGKRAKFEPKVANNQRRKRVTSPAHIKTLREGLARYRSSKKHGLEEK